MWISKRKWEELVRRVDDLDRTYIVPRDGGAPESNSVAFVKIHAVVLFLLHHLKIDLRMADGTPEHLVAKKDK